MSEISGDTSNDKSKNTFSTRDALESSGDYIDRTREVKTPKSFMGLLREIASQNKSEKEGEEDEDTTEVVVPFVMKNTEEKPVEKKSGLKFNLGNLFGGGDEVDIPPTSELSAIEDTENTIGAEPIQQTEYIENELPIITQNKSVENNPIPTQKVPDHEAGEIVNPDSLVTQVEQPEPLDNSNLVTESLQEQPNNTTETPLLSEASTSETMPHVETVLDPTVAHAIDEGRRRYTDSVLRSEAQNQGTETNFANDEQSRRREYEIARSAYADGSRDSLVFGGAILAWRERKNRKQIKKLKNEQKDIKKDLRETTKEVQELKNVVPGQNSGIVSKVEKSGYRDIAQAIPSTESQKLKDATINLKDEEKNKLSIKPEMPNSKQEKLNSVDRVQENNTKFVQDESMRNLNRKAEQDFARVLQKARESELAKSKEEKAKALQNQELLEAIALRKQRTNEIAEEAARRTSSAEAQKPNDINDFVTFNKESKSVENYKQKPQQIEIVPGLGQEQALEKSHEVKDESQAKYLGQRQAEMNRMMLGAESVRTDVLTHSMNHSSPEELEKLAREHAIKARQAATAGFWAAIAIIILGLTAYFYFK